MNLCVIGTVDSINRTHKNGLFPQGKSMRHVQRIDPVTGRIGECCFSYTYLLYM